MDEAPISALGGAMFRLPLKLDGLLRRHGYMLPKGAEDEIPLIRRDLDEIIAILQDHVSRSEDPSVMVNCWVKEARELSYDIEDCIDQYEHAADSKSKYVRKIPRRKFTSRKTNRSSEKLKQRLWMANKIREFSARVQELLQRHEMYNLGGIGRATTPTPTYDAPFRSPHHKLYREAADPVGIDAPMKKLEEWLIKDGEQKLKVISIVGGGGIGKTTLANELYCKLGGQFECRAFVRASQKPDMSRLLISMLSQVRPHHPPDNWRMHTLIAYIRKHLQDKRYLIVVDDVWATSTWDILNCALPDDNSCSRILITTEIEDVAQKCCGYESKYVFMMKPLGDDDSRKLFSNTVFGPQHECPPELSEVSNNIIRKCGGVPIATVTIASLLASQIVKLEQWEYVNKSLGYGLRTNTTLEGMKQVLNLSYHNLPSHLKACMLYLGMYEEDNIIWKDDLVKQWIAEGFLCSTEEQDKEEIFGSYFDELVSRRMIQPVHINDNDEVLSCVVHHMVLKLITHKSIEENFVISIDHSQTTTRLADKVRRLSLHFGNTEDATPPTNMRLSQVRTLAYFGVFKCMPSTVEFRLLQVLILHFWGDEDSINFDITRISELFRLRYLQITCNVTLELRTQMRGLQYLETLKIDARASAIPSDIVHLLGLMHLNLPAKTNLPNGIGHMTSLRTLGYFDLSGNSIENVQNLGELTNLRNLQLTCCTIQPDNLKDNIQCLGSILGKLSNLKSLTLVPTGGPSYVNFLDVAGARSMSISGDGLSNVSCPPALLQRLELSPRVCIFSTLPTWIGHLGKLCILKIGVRELARSDVDVLRGLPALTVLSLYVHTKPAERVVFDKAGFSVLKYFKFRCSVAWLEFEAGAMPNLRKLKLGFNVQGVDRYSTTIPAGIEHLTGLKMISAKIGGASAEEPDGRSAESALSDAIMMHPRHPNVKIQIQCVDWMFGGKDDESSRTQEEQHMTLQKQYEIMEEDEAGVQGPDPMLLAGAETVCATASPFVSPEMSSGSQVKTSKSMKRCAAHKKRKTLPTVRKMQMRVSDPWDLPGDGFRWRKYGEKDKIFGAKHPRKVYYRCTHGGCPARRKLQRTDGDPLLFDVWYQGDHTCAQNTQLRPRPAGTEHSGTSTTQSRSKVTVSGSMADDVVHYDLTSLALEYGGTDECPPDLHADILEGLRPPSSVTQLTIQDYRSWRYPSWLLLNQIAPRNLQRLQLNDCHELETLPDIGEIFIHLRELRLERLRSLKSLPRLPDNLKKLVIGWCTSLAFICMEDVEMLRTMFVQRASQADPSLKSVNPEGIAGLSPEQFDRFKATLCDLIGKSGNSLSYYRNSYNLMLENVFPLVWGSCIEEDSQLLIPGSVEHLRIEFCTITDSALRNCLRGCTSITCLELSGILCLTAIPFEFLTRLRELTITACVDLTILHGLNDLRNLENLTIKNCPNLNALQDSEKVGALRSLTVDDLSLVPELLSTEGRSSLTELRISDSKERKEAEFLQQLTSLISLQFWDCDWDTLPENLVHLTSLEDLCIFGCEKMQSLPVLPESLEHFAVYDCDREFMDSCQTHGDPNWQKIVHVRTKIIVNRELT